MLTRYLKNRNHQRKDGCFSQKSTDYNPCPVYSCIHGAPPRKLRIGRIVALVSAVRILEVHSWPPSTLLCCRTSPFFFEESTNAFLFRKSTLETNATRKCRAASDQTSLFLARRDRKV